MGAEECIVMLVGEVGGGGVLVASARLGRPL